jgi:hypothetical protein
MTKNIDAEAQKELKKLARKLSAKEVYVPVHDDPRDELRRLVIEHVGIIKRERTIDNITTDRKFQDGTVRKCPLPADIASDIRVPLKKMEKRKRWLESAMLINLRQLPIYTEFLHDVYGCGVVVAAYLAVFVMFDRCEKPSNLIARCGNANMRYDDGRATLAKPGHGKTKDERKIHWRPELRVRLWQMMGAMWKNAAAHIDKETGEVKKPAVSTKYLEIWREYKLRMQHSQRVVGNYIDLDWQEFSGAKALEAGTASVKKRVGPKGGTVMAIVDNETGKQIGEVRSAKKFIHDAGRRKATDVFLEDLYTIGRTLEGLPVWPSWYAAKLGYKHGGKVCVNAPTELTLEQAKELVGDVGAIPPVVLLSGSAEEEVEED